jgi:hypothetical protein
MIDLSLLSPEWIIETGQITLSTSSQRIAKINPRRFCLILCYQNNLSPPDAQANIAFITNKEDNIRFGLSFVASDFHTFEFTKYGSLVHSEWWARESGVNPTAGGIMTTWEVIQTAR